MSILIEGMEMPPQGEFKHIRIYDNGEVTVQVDTGKEVYEAVIAHAIPIPPHGDLIDRGALKKLLYEAFEDDDAHAFELGAYWHHSVVVGVVNNAPTIIEAEGK